MAQIRKRIALKVNDTYALELETHEGGGYLWSVASNDETVTEVQIVPRKPAQTKDLTPIGKSFPVQVEIKALAEGKTVVLLEEKRVWEKDIKPMNTCRIYITINQ